MQLCYVLTSSGNDLYEQMTCVSVSLARRLYPDAGIVLLVDEITDVNLRQNHSPLLLLVNRVVRVETGIEKAAPRSRFVKTSMRQVLDGDFVFLDADTLPIRRFDAVAATGAPLAAALDLDENTDQPAIPQAVLQLYRNFGWKAELPQYFNSGVIFMKDTPQARKFADEWHRRWRFLFERTGDHRDQPAFNSAIDATGIPVAVLDEAYNAAMYYLGHRSVCRAL